MIGLLKNSASGMVAQSLKIDTVANNVANVNTTGFKGTDVRFQDLMYRSVHGSGNPVVPQSENVLAVGQGVKSAATATNFMTGAQLETGRELDMSIVGEGFFRVTLPNGQVGFTRAGNFYLDANQDLVTENGYHVDLLPQELTGMNFASISISDKGMIRLYNEADEVIGQGEATIFRFTNQSGLAARGENIWLATENSGNPLAGRPGSDGFGPIVQRQLESSNVNLIEEMTRLISAQRAYEMSSRSVRTADEMWAIANQIRR